VNLIFNNYCCSVCTKEYAMDKPCITCGISEEYKISVSKCPRD